MDNSHYILKVVMRQTQCIVNGQQQKEDLYLFIVFIVAFKYYNRFFLSFFFGQLEKENL